MKELVTSGAGTGPAHQAAFQQLAEYVDSPALALCPIKLYNSPPSRSFVKCIEGVGSQLGCGCATHQYNVSERAAYVSFL